MTRTSRLVLLLLAAGSLLSACQSPKLTFQQEDTARLVQEGNLHYEAGKHSDAIKVYESAANFSFVRDDKRKIADLLNNKAGLLETNREFDEAIRYYQASLRISEELPYQRARILSSNRLGQVYTVRGEYHIALEKFDDALRESIGDYKENKALVLVNRAAVNIILARYPAAEIDLDEAQQLAHEYLDSRQRVRALIGRGVISLNYRDNQSAKKHFDNALKLARNSGIDDLVAETEHFIGSLYRQQADFGQAEEFYKRALKTYAALLKDVGGNANLRRRLTDGAMNVRRSLGEVYKELRRYDEALDELNRVLVYYKKARDVQGYAITSNYIGEVHFKKGQWEEADHKFTDAAGSFTSIGFPYGIGRSLVYRGHVALKIGTPEDAQRFFDRAVRLYTDLEDKDGLRRALYGRALSLEKQQRLQDAVGDYREAIELFESVKACVVGGAEAAKLYRESALDAAGMYDGYERLISLLATLGRAGEAHDVLVRSKESELQRQVLAGDFTGGNADLARRLDAINSLNCRLEDARRNSRSQKIVKTLEAELGQGADGLIAELDEKYPHIYRALAVKPDRRKSYERRLSSRHAIVQYFAREDEPILIFLISSAGTTVRGACVAESGCLNSKQVAPLVLAFREAIRSERFKENSRAFYGERCPGPESVNVGQESSTCISYLLYKYLVGPVSEQFEHVDYITIAPSGPLDLLPFSALGRTTKEGRFRYLVEDKRISMLYGNVSPSEQTQWPKSPRDLKIAGFTGPDDALKTARDELAAIGRNFPKAVLYAGPAATKESFRDAWGSSHIVHVAAHSDLHGDTPKILLSPSGEGSLTMREIRALGDKGDTRLVFLSSCESGVRVNARALGSLTDSFMFGKPDLRVVSTLWRIADDKHTSELVSRFYWYLSHDHRAAWALTESQRDLARREDVYSQPFYWAGFVFAGFPD